MRNRRSICSYGEGSKRENWHKNTTDLIGSEWLARGFEIISKDIALPINFILVSPSANLATHEKFLFNYIKQGLKYDPTFHLSDLCGEELSRRVEKEDGFMYKSINMRAQEITGEADIILDLKGALWYATCSSGDEILKLLKKKNATLELLNAYHSILNDESSILIFDITPKRCLFKRLLNKYRINRGENMDKVDFFGENSTYAYLLPILNALNQEDKIKKINCEINQDETPLAKYCRIGYITKKDLGNIIESLEIIPSWKVAVALLKSKSYQF